MDKNNKLFGNNKIYFYILMNFNFFYIFIIMNTKKTQEEHIHFRITKELKDAFKKNCIREGYSFSARIKSLMRKDAKIDVK